MISPVLFLFLGLIVLSALVVFAASIARLTGWRWPDEHFDPNHLSNEQRAYMKEVQMRNLSEMPIPVRGARGMMERERESAVLGPE